MLHAPCLRIDHKRLHKPVIPDHRETLSFVSYVEVRRKLHAGAYFGFVCPIAELTFWEGSLHGLQRRSCCLAHWMCRTSLAVETYSTPSRPGVSVTVAMTLLVRRSIT